MQPTESREKTTWIGSVLCGRSTRSVSSALVPSAMPAYWLPVAGSSEDVAAQVSPRSSRPAASGRTTSTVVQAAAVPARRSARAAAERSLLRRFGMRCMTGGPKDVAEL
ncbi:hypothetical protein [Streptomyces sp. MAR4 CNX-425]|uniref:hypothetical protein n=1 Tax=Streptomyces sp. MAR4 CNX-425 TaxID=3406343 RepID=UPI003B5042EB